MNFRKYAISMIICIVLIFFIFGKMFVPIGVSADVSNRVLSEYGYNIGLKYNFSSDYDKNITFQYGNERYNSDFLYKCLYDNFIYLNVFNSNSSGNYCEIMIINYDTMNFDTSKGIIFANYRLYRESFYIANGRNYSAGISGSNKTSYTISIPHDDYQVYLSYDMSISNSDDNSFIGRIWSGLKDLWYSAKSSVLNFGDTAQDVVDKFNTIGDGWCDFIKTTLGISDDDTQILDTALTDIYNNDYSSDFWVNYDNDTINQIKSTSNNIKNFWNNSVTVVDDGDNNYHYDFKNYNPTTNTYPRWYTDNDYFTNYILYQGNSTDISSIINWLQTIDFDINNNLNVLNTVVLAGFADINANFNAIGGVIAGAIGVAWAEIKLDLDSIFDDFIVKLNENLKISFDLSSDEDTTNNFYTNIENSFKSIFNDLLSDIDFIVDLKNLLSDLFFNVNVIGDSQPSQPIEPVSPDEPLPDNPDNITLVSFLETCKTIIISKIPLWGQCVELLSPISSLSIEDTNQYLIGDGSSDDDIVVMSDDIGTFKLLPVTHELFNGLVTIETDNVSSFGLGFETNNVKEFYGASFYGFNFDISYYYYHMRTQLSDFLLFICYLNFAWSIVHRVARIFKGSSSNNDNPVE